MKTREDLKKEVLHNLENRIKVWTENKYGSSTEMVNSQINMCNQVMENIEEATSIVAVNEARYLLYLYASDQMFVAYQRGINKGDEIDNYFSSISVPKITLLNMRNTSLWDECIQKIYSLMGNKNVLPTHGEIKELEFEIQRLRAVKYDENIIIDLEEQLNLKKCALGELSHQWSGGIPTYLSDNVRRTAQMEREMHQAALEASLNASSSVKR